MTSAADGWPSVPIGSVCLGIWDGPHATPKPADAGAVYLGIKNISEDGRLDLSEIRYIAEDDFLEWTKRVLPTPGDIVFTYEATLNRYAIIPQGFRGTLGRRLALIRPDPTKIDNRFLFYYFFGQEWRNTISKQMILGSTVDRIPIITFPKFEIRLPPPPTQRKIAGILSAYDDLIEVNTRRIALLEEMAAGLYREWFVRFRFPGHERARMVESAVGLVPEGWEVAKTTDAIDVGPPTRVPAHGEKPFVMMNGISTNTMLISEIEYRTGNNGSKFKNGDTLFARITPCLENGKTAFVQFLPTDEAVACGSTEFIVLRSRTLCPEFVYLLARSDAFRDNAIKSMTGASGRQRVQEACFDKFLFAHPDQKNLAAFAKLVSPLFRMVQLLADKNVNLRRTRDLLLPRLVAGEVGVGALDHELAKAHEDHEARRARSDPAGDA